MEPGDLRGQIQALVVAKAVQAIVTAVRGSQYTKTFNGYLERMEGMADQARVSRHHFTQD